MLPPLTPGAYLRLRRTAASMALADVAAQLSTQPRLAERARAQWIELIEADEQPATLETLIALHSTYPFSLTVLARLSALHLGAQIRPPRVCRSCGCSGDDACVGIVGTLHGSCYWVAEDRFSACRHTPTAAAKSHEAHAV